MNHLFNNEQRMTEIIFAHRNKAYGAYAIRSSYGETTVKAIGVVLLGITSIMSIAWHFSHNDAPPSDDKTIPFVDTSTYTIRVNLEDLPEDKIEPQPKSNDKPEAKPAGDALSTVISDTVEPTTAVDTSLATKSTPSVDPGDGNTTTLTDGGAGKKNDAGTGGLPGITPVKHAHELDKVPQFKGGLAALNEYLRLHVRYPQDAIDEGRQGKLFVRFIVDEKGKVSSAELLNSSYQDLNKEALRVVGTIPDFESPGMANGQPVKTYYQVPINFRLR